MDAARASRRAESVAFVGVGLVALSLALPWVTTRTCPPMRNCGPWSTQTGWSEFGVVAAIAFVLVAAIVLLRNATPRRIAITAVAALLGIALAIWRNFMDFTVFTDAQGPQVGFTVAVAGTALAFVAACTALVIAERTRPPDDAALPSMAASRVPRP